MKMLLLSRLAQADAGLEAEEPPDAEERPVALASVASAGPTAVDLPSPALPLCPSKDARCSGLSAVVPEGSSPWNGLVARDISGQVGVWRPKRRR